jgi:hypothetical protein
MPRLAVPRLTHADDDGVVVLSRPQPSAAVGCSPSRRRRDDRCEAVYPRSMDERGISPPRLCRFPARRRVRALAFFAWTECAHVTRCGACHAVQGLLHLIAAHVAIQRIWLARVAAVGVRLNLPRRPTRDSTSWRPH